MKNISYARVFALAALMAFVVLVLVVNIRYLIGFSAPFAHVSAFVQVSALGTMALAIWLVIDWAEKWYNETPKKAR